MPKTAIALLVTLCAAHADLATIVFWSDVDRPVQGDVYEVAVDGSSVRSLTKGRHPSSVFTPEAARDGRSIAYAAAGSNGYGQIWKATFDGKSYYQLTTTPTFKAHPSWSPDGNQIVFRSETDRTAIDLPDNQCLSGDSPGTYYLGCNDLFVLSFGTGESTNITADPGFDLLPAWSPSGQQIAYLRKSGTSLGDVWIWSNGLNTQITGTGDYESRPSWSPDGRLLAVGAYRGNGRSVIVILDDAGNHIAEPSSSFVWASEPAWSHDGSAIAFYGWDGEVGAIWRIRPDGSDATKVIDWARATNSMSWTPGEIPMTAILPSSWGSLKAILATGGSP